MSELPLGWLSLSALLKSRFNHYVSSRAYQNMSVFLTSVPEAECSSPVLDYLREIHRKFKDVNEGAVATYIPELAKADPDWFGVSLVTTGGEIYEVGDSRQSFTIQSISKPFVYGLALEDNTRAEVLTKVGVEPTGDAFNAISLEAGTGRPRNPMINAGAIAAAGLVEGKTPVAQFQRILRTLSLYAGRELALDESVYRSESETGHRNRAIGHMLRNFEILKVPPEPIADVYFKQCSISVNCRDLGLMAATLANGGINPVTLKQAIRGEYVESVLSVMASCGMWPIMRASGFIGLACRPKAESQAVSLRFCRDNSESEFSHPDWIPVGTA